MGCCGKRVKSAAKKGLTTQPIPSSYMSGTSNNASPSSQKQDEPDMSAQSSESSLSNADLARVHTE